LFLLACLPGTAFSADWFEPFDRVSDYQPKGPTHCFRLYNVDWSWIHRRPEQLPEFLSRADPAALAELCRQTHIDGAIVMAVPHHGYCSYETRVGRKFPGMKGDWFGRTVEELHKRRIAALGYVTLNWNWKYMRENLGRDFIHGRPDAQGIFPPQALICLNAPGYLDLVEAYTREVLEGYPVDGMRWDILNSARGCTCAGCKQLYRELYGRDLVSWDTVDARRQEDFYVATTSRAVLRLHGVCKRIKPSVEIWQNGLQSYTPNDINLGRQMDIAYNEYGDPFRLLLIRGVTGKSAAINGLMNDVSSEPPAALDHRRWRRCLALGGRCYSYYGHLQTDPRTGLPSAAMLAWYRDQLAPFYEMAGRIQPWLEDAAPVSQVGVVFCERTRFRFPHGDRKPYMEPMEALTNAFLERSLPLEFVNCLDLGDPRKPIARFKLLVLPLSSGLTPDELQHLRRYVAEGGSLLVVGDALRHDERGNRQSDFALSAEMGLSCLGTVDAKHDLPLSGNWTEGTPEGERSMFSAPGTSAKRPVSPKNGPVPSRGVRNFLRVRPFSGQTLLSATWEGASCPFLHVNVHGRGKVVYLSSSDSVELTESVVDGLAGPPPVVVEGPEHPQVLLTRQPRQGRWILHAISDGDYSVEIRGDDVPARRVTAAYPASGWQWQADRNAAGMRIKISGPAADRLLVLE
jgi:hypothetical protein